MYLWSTGGDFRWSLAFAMICLSRGPFSSTLLGGSACQFQMRLAGRALVAGLAPSADGGLGREGCAHHLNQGQR